MAEIPVSVNPKLQLAGEIGQLETAVAQAEGAQREADAKLKSAKNNRTAGAVVTFIGLILLLFFGGVLAALGVGLAIVGGLTLLTAIAKQSAAQKIVRAGDQQIAELRGKLAEKRAQLAVA